MGISLHIEGADAGEFELNLRGLVGLLAIPQTTAPPLSFDNIKEEVVAEIGANPSVSAEPKMPKMRGRPAKVTPVTIEVTAEPGATVGQGPRHTEEVATTATDPTATAPTPATETPKEAVAGTGKPPTVDDVRDAMKALTKLPNGQELCYAALSELGVKSATEAYLKDAVKFIAICQAKLEAAK